MLGRHGCSFLKLSFSSINVCASPGRLVVISDMRPCGIYCIAISYISVTFLILENIA